MSSRLTAEANEYCARAGLPLAYTHAPLCSQCTAKLTYTPTRGSAPYRPSSSNKNASPFTYGVDTTYDTPTSNAASARIYLGNNAAEPDPATTNSTSAPVASSSTLSTGAIVGITLGVLAVLALIAAASVVVAKRVRMSKGTAKSLSGDNDSTTGGSAKLEA